MRYRLKPTEVEAFNFKGEAFADLPDWAQKYKAYTNTNGTIGISRLLAGNLMVPIRNQLVRCEHGDWLTFDGTDLSVISKGDFSKLFEPITDDSDKVPADEAGALR